MYTKTILTNNAYSTTNMSGQIYRYVKLGLDMLGYVQPMACVHMHYNRLGTFWREFWEKMMVSVMFSEIMFPKC